MFDEKRLSHLLGVANLMKSHAREFDLDENEMFLLGFLHDVGYLFCDDDHERVGGNFLREQGYKYWKEVENHGKVNCKASSAQKLLNWCDMHVDLNGKFVTFEERLNDIAKRRGQNSLAYQKAEKIIEDLQKENLK